MILLIGKVLLVGAAILTFNRLVRREPGVPAWLKQIEVGALIGSLFLFILYHLLIGNFLWVGILFSSLLVLVLIKRFR